MTTLHDIQKITFVEGFIYLQINGKELKASLEKVSKKLKAADDFQRSFYKISPSGYGIHWPLIDEDISIDGLMKNG